MDRPRRSVPTGPRPPGASIPARLARWPRDRLAERVSAASYGTILVLVALALLDADDVSSGLGWELVTGVGMATWIAHLYAELVGDHLRDDSAIDRSAIKQAAADGLPIILAAVAPAIMLLLGRLGALGERGALWASLVVAIVQLVGIGAYVGSVVSLRGANAWTYAAATAAMGMGVVALKLVLGH